MRDYPSAPIFAAYPTSTNQEIADLAGVSLKTATRWRGGGPVSGHIADRVAIGLGRHPLNFWPEWAEPVDPNRGRTTTNRKKNQ